jgi:hypothetical protein
MTDQELVHLVFNGSAEDWQRLHEYCQDRVFATRLLWLLEENGAENPSAAAAWKEYLIELGYPAAS